MPNRLSSDPTVVRRFECVTGIHFKYYLLQAWLLDNGRYDVQSTYGKMRSVGHNGSASLSNHPNVWFNFMTEKVQEKLGKGYVEVPAMPELGDVRRQRGGQALAPVPVQTSPAPGLAPVQTPVEPPKPTMTGIQAQNALATFVRPWANNHSVFTSETVYQELRGRNQDKVVSYTTAREALESFMGEYIHYQGYQRTEERVGQKIVDRYFYNPDLHTAQQQHQKPSDVLIRQTIILVTAAARSNAQDLIVSAVHFEVKTALPEYSYIPQYQVRGELYRLCNGDWKATYALGEDNICRVIAGQGLTRADMLDL